MKENKKTKKSVNSALWDNLRVILPMIGVFVLIVGGIVLLYVLDKNSGTPTAMYTTAKELVKEDALIGLTLEECNEKIGAASLFDSSNDWIFMAGSRTKKSGETIYYEIVIKNENGRATKAILQEIE